VCSYPHATLEPNRKNFVNGWMDGRKYVGMDGRTHPTSVSLLGHCRGDDLIK